MDRQKLLGTWWVILILASCAEARKWTDVSGKQISADYIRVHNGEVILRQGGRLLKCPYEQFSEADKAYIREQLESGQKKSKRQVGVNQIGGSEEPEADADGARELRTWQDVQGNKILAQYTGFSLENVELLRNGERVSYPYSAFSRADQMYVAEILTAEGRADEIPKTAREGEAGSYGAAPAGGSGYGGVGPMDMGSMSPEPDYGLASSPEMPSYGAEESYGPGNVADYGAGPSGSSYPPDATPHAGSTFPDFPSTSAGPIMEPQMVLQKRCTKCNGIVPNDTKVGDRCPHCHVIFGYEIGADGKRTSAGESWRFRWAVIRLSVVGFFLVVAALVALSRRS